MEGETHRDGSSHCTASREMSEPSLRTLAPWSSCEEPRVFILSHQVK
jgi:hypothetical protein